MKNASVGPVERSSMISALEAASQQQVLPICCNPDRLQLVCTFPYSQHYSCSIFKADREMHLQSLNAAVPACWITWCCYQRAGEETQTHTPQLQSNRMKTPMHARTRPCTNILVLRNPVEKINTLSPELHTVMRSSAISQRFHQKGSYKYSV